VKFKSLAVNEYFPVLVTTGSVITWALNSIEELKCWDISELSSEDCRIDIAVAPTKIATITTNNLDFLKHSGIRTKAPIHIRHADTALCIKAPPHRATPRAIAL